MKRRETWAQKEFGPAFQRARRGMWEGETEEWGGVPERAKEEFY